MAACSTENVARKGHNSFLLYHARMWFGAPAIQLVLSSNAALQLLDLLQQHHNEKNCMLAYSSARGLPIVGPPLLFQLWRALHIPTLSNKTCWTVNPMTSIVLLWTSEPGICFTGSLSLAHIRESVTVNVDLPPGVCSTYKQGPGYTVSLPASQMHAPWHPPWCRSQRYPIQNPSSHLCYEKATWNHMSSTTRDEANDNIQGEQHISISALIPEWSPSAEICSSIHWILRCVCFLKPEQQ